jgi:hypothetical protein
LRPPFDIQYIAEAVLGIGSTSTHEHPVKAEEMRFQKGRTDIKLRGRGRGRREGNERRVRLE